MVVVLFLFYLIFVLVCCGEDISQCHGGCWGTAKSNVVAAVAVVVVVLAVLVVAAVAVDAAVVAMDVVHIDAPGTVDAVAVAVGDGGGV